MTATAVRSRETMTSKKWTVIWGGIVSLLVMVTGSHYARLSAERNAALDIVHKAFGRELRYQNYETFGDVWFPRFWRGIAPIEEVQLDSTQLSDNLLEALDCFPELRILSLEFTNLKPEHLSQIRRLPNLRVLFIGCNEIGDDYTDEICKFKNLEELDVQTTLLTEAALERIRESLPDTKVYSVRRR